MPVNDDLGIRMKEFYENIPKTRLMRRTPVAIRMDGKAFHTFTKDFQKPFDQILIKSMQETMKSLCENIQGCVLGYAQSDEITLILIDYKKLTSDAWFGYEVQKMCSIAASMTTITFYRCFNEAVNNWYYFLRPCDRSADELWSKYMRSITKGAMFDARCFNIPKEEVTNLIYWRQLDAIRNSIQMVGQANFSHKELQNKSCNQIQNMLLEQKGINWDDFPTHIKRGSCCIKVHTNDPSRSTWIIDNEIPVFKGENREYIDRLIKLEDI